MVLKISDALSPLNLRRWARRCGTTRGAARAYAIANALDGMTRAQAARLAGLERQALRDAVIRYNAEGLQGLFDRQAPGRAPFLSEDEQAALVDAVRRGPDRDSDGVCTWTCEALAVWISRTFGKALHPDSVGRIVRRNRLSRQKARQGHPKADAQAQERFQKKTWATR